jgi:folate-binding protein YgfZ
MTLQHDYQIIREAAAIGATDERRQIAVTGKDRASYLQGLLTNDIPALTAGTGCYSAWLSPQGRMLTDMHVLESGTMILLDVPAAAAPATLERLEQFIFTEDVQVASLADGLTGIWLHGPTSAAVLERTIDGARDLATWPEYHHEPLSLRGDPVSIVRISQLGVPGYCMHVERGRAADLTAALEASGAEHVSAEALNAARVEAAYPLFGIDMTEEIIPLEAGIESRAISFTKGCYVGQEIVIRVLHRGHGRVAKKLVSLRFDDGAPERGAKLHAGEREVGYVTSAAESPRFGAIGLGYVHRDFSSPGSVLTGAAVIPSPVS